MKIKIILVTAILGMFSVCSAQQNDIWKQWEWLKGEWAGSGSGQTGEGKGTFSFTNDLGNRILVRKSHSEYPSKNIVHDDLMIIYADYSGNPGNAIYFDNEGHTINYTITYADNSIVFLSEKVQGAPLFRLIYENKGSESVNVIFQMSKDGETFITYVEGLSKRIK